VSDVQISINEDAERTIGDMRRRVDDIGMTYGRSSDEYVNAMRSLLDNLLGVLRLGGRISKDGELSLYGVSFIHYGVIWFAKRNGDERDPLLGDWSTHS
jgi:hypothetical protein